MKSKRLTIFVVLFLVLVASIILAIFSYPALFPRFTIIRQNLSPPKSISSTSVRVNEKILDQLPLWAPDIEWGPASVVNNIDSGNGKLISGVSRIGAGTSPKTPFVIQTKIHEELTNSGWQTSGPSEGVGGSYYRYTKNEQGEKRIVELYYQPLLDNPDGPTRTVKCPCTYWLTVVFSDLYQ